MVKNYYKIIQKKEEENRIENPITIIIIIIYT